MDDRQVVPVVLFGRFATLAGTGSFRTVPLNVIPYDSIDLAIWRGTMIAGGSFRLDLETSMDQQSWTILSSTDPGAGAEAVVTHTLNRSWLRATVVLAHPTEFPVVSCYAVGQLVKRRGG